MGILANRLIEKEVIFREDLEEIFGKRPFEDSDSEKPKEKKHDRPADIVASETENSGIVSSIPKDENLKT